MDEQFVFLPVFVQVALTLYVYVRLQLVKARAMKAGQVDEARRALHEDAWPDSVRQVNNNIRNQFETPVLFYALVLVLWSLHAAGTAAQVVAWLWAASRLVHAYVHTGSNIVRIRRPVFTFGVVMLAVMTGLAVAAVIQY